MQMGRRLKCPAKKPNQSVAKRSKKVSRGNWGTEDIGAQWSPQLFENTKILEVVIFMNFDRK